MNWGRIIVFTLIVFVLFILGMSIYMFTSPGDDYDRGYYEKGLNFDHDFNREARVVADHARPGVKVAKTGIIITFIQPARGKVKFLRPSSSAMDHIFPIDGQTLIIPGTAIARGKWQLVFDWKSNDRSYLYEQEIYFK